MNFAKSYSISFLLLQEDVFNVDVFLKNVFNADQTGLSYKLLPNDTLTFKGAQVANLEKKG